MLPVSDGCVVELTAHSVRCVPFASYKTKTKLLFGQVNWATRCPCTAGCLPGSAEPPDSQELVFQCAQRVSSEQLSFEAGDVGLSSDHPEKVVNFSQLHLC